MGKGMRGPVLAALLAAAACEAPGPTPGHPGEPRGEAVAASATLRPVVEATTAGDVEALRGFLAHRDPRVRARAAFGAAGVADADLLSALAARLDDPSPAVRADAAFALSRTPAPSGDPAAGVEALLGRLERERHPGVRAALLRALGRCAPADVSTRVAREDPAGVAAATEALAEMAGRGALTPVARDTLLARLTHTEPAVREAAARGIAVGGGPDLWIRHRDVLRAALAAWGTGEPAARHLLGAFGRLLPRATLVPWTREPPDPRVRLAAVRALAAHPDGPATVDDLAAALGDPHPWIRQAAALGLAELATGSAAFGALGGVVGGAADAATEEAWLKALVATGRRDELVARVSARDPHDGVAWRAAVAVLPGTGDPELTALLLPAAEGPLPAVRRAARSALGLPPDSTAMDAPAPTSPSPGRPWTADDWAELALLGAAPRLILETAAGRVVVRLDPDAAPVTVLHLHRRVAAGLYDGTRLHRSLPGALVQWGVPGPAGPGPVAETAPVPFVRGTVGWAASGEEGDDDLFVALDELPELEGRHTPVGRVTEGIDVLEALVPGAVIVRAWIEPSRTNPLDAGTSASQHDP